MSVIWSMILSASEEKVTVELSAIVTAPDLAKVLALLLRGCSIEYVCALSKGVAMPSLKGHAPLWTAIAEVMPVAEDPCRNNGVSVLCEDVESSVTSERNTSRLLEEFWFSAQVQTQQTNSLGSPFAFRNEITFETDSDSSSNGSDLDDPKNPSTIIDS